MQNYIKTLKRNQTKYYIMWDENIENLWLYKQFTLVYKFLELYLNINIVDINLK